MTAPARTWRRAELVAQLQAIENRLGQGLAVGALAAADTAGGLFAWQNPHAYDVEVFSVELVTTTFTSGACTADVGMTATDATTSADNLIDGVSLATAVKRANSLIDNGTNGRGIVVVAAGKWITGSVASGASAALVGSYRIHYRKVESAYEPIDLSDL